MLRTPFYIILLSMIAYKQGNYYFFIWNVF
jgi:hypothetical protein